jgi:hypothetical protein
MRQESNLQDLAVHTVFKTGPLANGVCASILVPGHGVTTLSTRRAFVPKSCKIVASQSGNAMVDARQISGPATADTVAGRSGREPPGVSTETSCEMSLDGWAALCAQQGGPPAISARWIDYTTGAIARSYID